MLLHPIEISQTASSGAWSFNTLSFRGGEVKQILIKAATATTTFNFGITDEKGNLVYYREGITGELNDCESYLPVRGIYTLAVDTSTVDEAFTGRVLVNDE